MKGNNIGIAVMNLLKGKRQKVVRFLISPKKKKVKIEVNKIMNPLRDEPIDYLCWSSYPSLAISFHKPYLSSISLSSCDYLS